MGKDVGKPLESMSIQAGIIPLSFCGNKENSLFCTAARFRFISSSRPQSFEYFIYMNLVIKLYHLHEILSMKIKIIDIITIQKYRLFFRYFESQLTEKIIFLWNTSAFQERKPPAWSSVSLLIWFHYFHRPFPGRFLQQRLFRMQNRKGNIARHQNDGKQYSPL